jgi:hypothetical protein
LFAPPEEIIIYTLRVALQENALLQNKCDDLQTRIERLTSELGERETTAKGAETYVISYMPFKLN